MSAPEPNPEAAVAELIATLPDDYDSLTPRQLRAVRDAHDHITDAYAAAADAQHSVLDCLKARGCPPNAPFGEYATDAEAAEMRAALHRMTSAAQADAALKGWERRAGASREEER